MLSALKNQDGFYQINPAEELEAENAISMRMTDVVEAQGFVSRHLAKDDRRAKIIMLTKQGRKIIDEVEAYANEPSNDVMKSIDEKSIRMAMVILQHIADAAEKEGRV